MLTLARKPYLNLDKHLPLDTIPDIENAIIDSYDLINHNNWHGSHERLPYWNFSFKIEGIFSQNFREQISIGHLDLYYYED